MSARPTLPAVRPPTSRFGDITIRAKILALIGFLTVAALAVGTLASFTINQLARPAQAAQARSTITLIVLVVVAGVAVMWVIGLSVTKSIRSSLGRVRVSPADRASSTRTPMRPILALVTPSRAVGPTTLLGAEAPGAPW